MIFNMEEKIYKQMKLSPIKNPNYEQKETPEQLCNLIGRNPIIIHDANENMIGQTIPGTAVIIDDFICGDIRSWSTDLSLYKWNDAETIMDPHIENIIRYKCIEYIPIYETKIKGMFDRLFEIQRGMSECDGGNFFSNTDLEVISAVILELQKPSVLYLCDTKACSDCHGEPCYHTTDITHAVNFEVGIDGVYYVEKLLSKEEKII